MYDRSAMHRAASYSHPQYQPQSPPKHYPTAHSTSSAFSASANPNEDWTKISDLAERRRIQNRIAQRNYRKKLKKRMEDLERRAGSSSTSPEPKTEELSQPETSPRAQANNARRNRSNSSQIPTSRTPDFLSQPHGLQSDDRGMFSQQYTRQMSTSPPPFSYASIQGTEGTSFGSYPPGSNYCAVPGSGIDIPLYPSYLPPIQQSYMQSMGSGGHVKQEFFGADDEMSPFSMSYASMAGVDVSTAASSHSSSYQDVAHHPPAYVSNARKPHPHLPIMPQHHLPSYPPSYPPHPSSFNNPQQPHYAQPQSQQQQRAYSSPAAHWHSGNTG